MTAQQALSAAIPWELLFLAIPFTLLYIVYKIRERIAKQRETKIGRRKHFFS